MNDRVELKCDIMYNLLLLLSLLLLLLFYLNVYVLGASVFEVYRYVAYSMANSNVMWLYCVAIVVVVVNDGEEVSSTS